MSERAPLGLGLHLAIAGAAVLLLVVAALLVVELQKRRTTRARLEEWAFYPRNLRVTSRIESPHELFLAAQGVYFDAMGGIALEMEEPPLTDAWGNPFRYASPGPVHKKGWDLWSCGPNGEDDRGGFDDILVGEDVPTESSR